MVILLTAHLDADGTYLAKMGEWPEQHGDD